MPLPLLEGNQKPDLGGSKEMGARSKDIEERLEVTERNHVTPSERTSLKDKLLTVRG